MVLPRGSNTGIISSLGYLFDRIMDLLKEHSRISKKFDKADGQARQVYAEVLEYLEKLINE